MQHITHLKFLNKNDKELLPIFFVIIENSQVNKDNLNSIRYINQIRIYIEVHKSKGFKQYYKFQRFPHSSFNCTFLYRYLKCGENHASSECKNLDLCQPNAATAKALTWPTMVSVTGFQKQKTDTSILSSIKISHQLFDPHLFCLNHLVLTPGINP